MVATKQYIEELRENGWKINHELETMILSKYSEDPNPHVWSEQDLFEQTTREINQYNEAMRNKELPFGTSPF